jgi:hypothetical protein
MSTALSLIDQKSVARQEAQQPQSISVTEMMTMADMFCKSGMFGDVRDIAKAFVKIQAGRELGVPPFASMRGVSIIQGNAALGSTLIAGRMKAHGYEWEEIARTEDRCELRILKPNGKVAGTSCFTMEDAKRAGLDGKVSGWAELAQAAATPHGAAGRRLKGLQNAMSERVPSAGGFLVPEVLRSDMMLASHASPCVSSWPVV